MKNDPFKMKGFFNAYIRCVSHNSFIISLLLRFLLFRIGFWYMAYAMNNNKSNSKENLVIIAAWLFALALVFIVYWKIKILINR